MKKNTITALLYQYRHALLLLYFPVYMAWFTWLQGRTEVAHTLMYCKLDDYIPFCEYFIVPYLLWFIYVFVAMAFFFFVSPREFVQACIFLFAGMTFCLFIYTVLPNGQGLRPYPEHKNWAMTLINMLWDMDPAINVCPSVHTYNSIGIHIALWRSPSFKNKPVIRYGSLILCILIIISTVCLKQHSILDVIAAMILAVPLYFFTYRRKRASWLERKLAA